MLGGGRHGRGKKKEDALGGKVPARVRPLGRVGYGGGARRGAEGSGRSAQERAPVWSDTPTMWPF